MRNILILLVFIICAHSLATVKPVEVEIENYNVYVPKGFDSNDSSEIIVSGILPSHCFQAPKVEVKGANPKEIEVIVRALYSPIDQCLQVAIPFTLTVPLGILDSGDYKIKANNLKTDSMRIDLASTIAMDENIYANVEYIEENDYDRTVTLVGTNPSNCFELDRIDYTTNGNNTISILPILKLKSQECLPIETDFEYEFKVPNTLSANVLLLHVRKMNGKSVNRIFRNKL